MLLGNQLVSNEGFLNVAGDIFVGKIFPKVTLKYRLFLHIVFLFIFRSFLFFLQFLEIFLLLFIYYVFYWLQYVGAYFGKDYFLQTQRLLEELSFVHLLEPSLNFFQWLFLRNL